MLTVGLLGPLRVTTGGEPVAVTAPMQRALLAYLALARGRAATREQLVDALWTVPPGRAVNVIQHYVSALRHTLGAPALVTTGRGYELSVAAEDVDAHSFRLLEKRADEACQEGALQVAARLHGQALALYRGEPLSDLPDSPFVDASRVALQRMLVGAQLKAIAVENDLGHFISAMERAELLMAAEPLDESVAVELMRALAGAGRQADALAVYERMRVRLDDELGLEPSLRLRATQAAVLNQDGVLGAVQIPSLSPEAAHGQPVALTNEPADLLATADSAGLPGSPTPTFGRDADIDFVVGALVDGARLVTVTGPGGMGKTRLAIETARVIQERGHGPVDFVDLSPLREAHLVSSRIADHLEPRRPASSDPRSVVAARYRDGGLLVLDNMEQVVGAAHDVARLLDAAPALRVMVTSRQALQLRIETVHHLGPLPTVDQSGTARSAAVAMFCDRTDAGGARQWSAAEEEAARTIVALVDGLPLGIELAAARCRMLGPRALATRLAASMSLLRDGPVDLPQRQRSMQQTIEWSLDLLEPDLRTAFGRLAVFRAGFDVSGVCALLDCDEPAALSTIEALADASLLRVVQDADGEPRISMLQVLKSHTLDLLSESERSVAADRHAAWVVSLCRGTERGLRSEQAAAWLARLDRHREDIVAAVNLLSRSGRVDDAASLMDALLRYWLSSPGSPDGQSLTDTLLAVESLSERSRGTLLLLSSRLHERRGDYARAAELAGQSADLSQRSGDRATAGHAYAALASSTLWLGRPEESRQHWQRSLELTDVGEDAEFRTLTLGNLGLLALDRGDFSSALAIYESALDHLQKLGVVDAVTDTLMNLAWAHLGLGQLEEARDCLRESGTRAVQQGGTENIAYHLLGVARLASLSSEHSSALALTASATALLASSGQVFEPYELSVVDAIAAAAPTAPSPGVSASTQPATIDLDDALELSRSLLDGDARGSDRST